MSSETSLHNLLTDLNPEVEAKLLGSQAEFSQLSNTKPFTIDKVNYMSGQRVMKNTDCVCVCVRVRPCVSITDPTLSSQVVNKVFFEMSEEGAEVQDKVQEAGIPLKLSINRPFFFSVIEGDSGAILMLGKVTNPTL